MRRNITIVMHVIFKKSIIFNLFHALNLREGTTPNVKSLMRRNMLFSFSSKYHNNHACNFQKRYYFQSISCFLSLQNGFERRYHTSCEIVKEC